MSIIIIAAMDKNRVIGVNNKLPWHLSEDLKNFKQLTSGNTVIMGRKTFESIGKPLPNRHNIVISSSMLLQEGMDVCASVQEAIKKARTYGKDIFIIGGASIFEQTIPLADKMYLSYVKKTHEGDAFFPAFNEKEWKVERRDDRGEFEFVVYTRKGKVYK